MTAQIERNPREGVELRTLARLALRSLRRLTLACGRAAAAAVWRALRWIGARAWERREGLSALICYGIVYCLALALTYRDPVFIGLTGFLGAIAAIVGHCLSEVANVRDR